MKKLLQRGENDLLSHLKLHEQLQLICLHEKHCIITV